MAHAGFAMSGRNQLAQDAASVIGVIFRALGTQNRKLFVWPLLLIGALVSALLSVCVSGALFSSCLLTLLSAC